MQSAESTTSMLKVAVPSFMYGYGTGVVAGSLVRPWWAMYVGNVLLGSAQRRYWSSLASARAVAALRRL